MVKYQVVSVDEKFIASSSSEQKEIAKIDVVKEIAKLDIASIWMVSDEKNFKYLISKFIITIWNF